MSEQNISLFFSISKCVSLLGNCVLSFLVADCLTSFTLCHKHCMCGYDIVSDELCVCLLIWVKNLLSSLLNLPFRKTRHIGVTTDPNGDSKNHTSVRS